MFKDSNGPTEVTGYARDKDCLPPADNGKDQIKSELLFARQPDLAAAHTPAASPLAFLRKQRGEVAETSIFFRENDRKRANDELQTILYRESETHLQPLYGYLASRGRT